MRVACARHQVGGQRLADALAEAEVRVQGSLLVTPTDARYSDGCARCRIPLG